MSLEEPAADSEPDGHTTFDLPKEIRDLVYRFHYLDNKLKYEARGRRKPVFWKGARKIFFVSRHVKQEAEEALCASTTLALRVNETLDLVQWPQEFLHHLKHVKVLEPQCSPWRLLPVQDSPVGVMPNLETISIGLAANVSREIRPGEPQDYYMPELKSRVSEILKSWQQVLFSEQSKVHRIVFECYTYFAESLYPKRPVKTSEITYTDIQIANRVPPLSISMVLHCDSLQAPRGADYFSWAPATLAL